MTRLASLVGLVFLTACAVSPEDRCFATSTRALATTLALISETEDNLLRGYGWEQGTWTDLEVSDCYATLSPSRICSTQTDTTVLKAVVLNLAEQEQALKELRARLPVLKSQARADYAACLVNARAE